MGKFEVTMSFNDWRDSAGRRTRVSQVHNGRTPKDAGKAAVENLQEEYRNDAENIKIVSIKPSTPKKAGRPKSETHFIKVIEHDGDFAVTLRVRKGKEKILFHALSAARAIAAGRKTAKGLEENGKVTSLFVSEHASAGGMYAGYYVYMGGNHFYRV